MRYALAGLLGIAWLFGAQALAATPCSGQEYRAFDFWLGEWNVFAADGTLAGTNSIAREYDGCVIHERYAKANGYRGESLNMYDASRGRWHQSWVDNTGLLLLLDGGMRNGKMVMEGRIMDADGEPRLHRITWTPKPDGSVRQIWESSDETGKMATEFDGLYRRQ